MRRRRPRWSRASSAHGDGTGSRSRSACSSCAPLAGSRDRRRRGLILGEPAPLGLHPSVRGRVHGVEHCRRRRRDHGLDALPQPDTHRVALCGERVEELLRQLADPLQVGAHPIDRVPTPPAALLLGGPVAAGVVRRPQPLPDLRGGGQLAASGPDRPDARLPGADRRAAAGVPRRARRRGRRDGCPAAGGRQGDGRAVAVHDVRRRVRDPARRGGSRAALVCRVRGRDVSGRGIQRGEHTMSTLTVTRTQSRPHAPTTPATTEGVGTQRLTLAKAINLGLGAALEADPTVLLMGEDIGALGGVFRVTDGLQKEFGADRVVDTPLAESGIVGTAIGLALRGYRPVCEIQFDGFVFPAFDQITTQLAKMHYRTRGKLSLPVVIRIPYGGGIGAVEHHSESPEVLFAHTPGLRVVSPATPADAFTMIQEAIASPDPVLFFEPKGRYWDKGDVDLDVAYGTSTGGGLDRARVVRPGRDLTCLLYTSDAA